MSTQTQSTDEVPFGALDAPDPRDYVAEQILGAGEEVLPKEVLLPLSEGNQGADVRTKVACTCYSAYHVAQIANEIENKVLISPDFMKGWELQGAFGTRIPSGDYVQTALKSIVKNGLKTKDELTYNIKGYAKIEKSEIKSWLARGFAIVTSGPVTNTNFKQTKITGIWGGKDGAIVGGHAFCLVGYDENFYRASNSYGPTYGALGDGTFKIKPQDLDALGTCYILFDEKSVENTVYLFKDVTDKSPSYNAIKFVKDLGLMTGYLDGRFGPTDNLTREQMAIVLERFYTLVEKNFKKV